MTYFPTEGDILTVSLPNEATRATVVNVIDEDTIEAVLDQSYPFTRLHGYNFGDRLHFRREEHPLGQRWAVSDAPPKSYPADTTIRRVAPPDEHEAAPAKPKAAQTAKRRSDADTKRPSHG